jgi:NADH-quinone oxidoreductase subunit A
MIYNFLSDYFSIILFLFIAIVLSFGFVVANFLAAPSNPDPEKLSAYECGFEAFDDSRMEFDVRFYLVAILFIIFDLEIAFLFPWAISLGNIGALGFWSIAYSSRTLLHLRCWCETGLIFRSSTRRWKNLVGPWARRT